MRKQTYTGHPDARKTKYNPLAWLNLVLLAIIVIACNYIGCSEYARRDLSQDLRYTISERTVNVLSSERIQKRDTPVRIIFAFKQTIEAISLNGFIFLLCGGIAYTIGAVLYGVGKKKKYFHSIFHLFILLGTILQFFAILFYVM